MKEHAHFRRIVKILFFLGLVFILGCGGSGGGSDPASTSEDNSPAESDPVERMIENLGVNVIMGTYTELVERARELQSAMEALNENKTQANLDLAKEAWKTVRSYWTQSEAFFLGPVVYEELGAKLDSWPPDIDELDQILAEHETFSIFFVLNLDSTLSGLHVMEYLLFGEESGNEKSLDRFTAREIEYLWTTSRVVMNTALQIKFDWDSPTGYSDPYVNNFIGIDTNFSQSYQLLTLVTAMLQLVEEMADIKLAKPLGDSSAQADPTLIESRFSGNTLNELQDNIRGILSLYTGDFGEKTGAGMDEFVAEHGSSEASERVKNEIESTLQAIGEIGDEQQPLREMITDLQGRTRIQTAIESLENLRQTLETEVLSLLACGKFNQLNPKSVLCEQFEAKSDEEESNPSESTTEDSNDDQENSSTDQMLGATDFECILNWTKVRNFRITNKWDRLEETLSVANSPEGKRYPPGTLIQLLPTEAMFKQTEGWNPQTNDWEFFSLDPSESGTQILSRGTIEVFNQRGENCFSCHSQAEAQWDFTCETAHGCDSHPLKREELDTLQNNDPRC